MNKANVFLLVVVSSLLTYISTATQPGATAGVAQEKWEVGKSAYNFYHEDAEQTYRFEMYNGRRDLYVSFNSKTGYLRPAKISGDSQLQPEKTYVNFDIEVRKLIREIGAQGWEPYQVLPYEGELVGFPTMYWDTIYWRRRVQ